MRENSNRFRFGRPAQLHLLCLFVIVAAGLVGCRASNSSHEEAPTQPRVDTPSQETTSSAKNAVAPAPSNPSAATVAKGERVVRIEAKRFEYAPASITLAKGVPVVLELVSLDRVHGFSAPDFGLRSDIRPDAPTRLRFVPDRAGTFEFHCDVFCGDGHEEMTGEIIVRD